MGALVKIYQRLLTGLVIALATSCTRVTGGPDHAILDACFDLYKSLRPEQRHAVRDAVQDLQAIASYLGQLRLGRPLPQSSVTTAVPTTAMLEEWKAHNTTKLQQVLNHAEVAQRLGVSADGAAALAATCMSSRLRHDGYTGRPVVSILLNYFKRPQVVAKLAANMRASCASASVPCELVVNVDNPHEAGAWAEQVQGGFVVPAFSANLHEARGYNRAARVARGRYLVIWQDDQVPPPSGQWLVDMIKVFDAYPQLGILGMNCYRLCKHHEPTNRWGFSNWDPDPLTGVRWTYAQTVDFAPMAIRASIYETVGGLDEGMSRPGDCGIWGDWELSTRVWMDGWQVGHIFADGRTGDGAPGTTHQGANGEKCWGRQQHVAMHVYARRFGVNPLQHPMCERVWLLNVLTFTVKEARQCPYGTDQTRWGNCTRPPEDVASAALAEFSALAAAARGRVGIGGGGALHDAAWGSAGGRGAAAAEAKALAAAAMAELAAKSKAAAEGAKAAEAKPAEAAGSGQAAEAGSGQAAEAGSGQAAGAGEEALGSLGIMDINPVLVRAAGSAAGRRYGRRTQL